MSNKYKSYIGWILALGSIPLIQPCSLIQSIGIGIITIGAMFIEDSKHKTDDETTIR